ncbi:MAG: hypothetical protein IPL61_39485 [Myxococcales bacterium]|nr:hypothetical protein [Myxococcales bacterium]
MPRPWSARVVALVALSLLGACAFDPRATSGMPDAADAADPDGGPIDAVDALPVDACVPRAGGELCNGLDDDCDGFVDEAFATLGTACDGPDTDLCLDDLVHCAASGTTTECGDATADDDVELCNGADDDCDLATDEGFPGLGVACDGADADLCAEGMVVCTSDGLGVVCSDATADSLETCNGADDDCDLATDEGFALGTACDGTDGDACLEGVVECDPSTGGARCTDTTGTIVELCNNVDDDCDIAIDETFDLTSDVMNCGLCGRTCSNSFGTTACMASTCAPTCAAGANDCDGNPVTGCELRDTNPACAGATALGFVNGDSASTALTATGYGEAFYTVSVREVVAGNNDVRAQVTLTSPPGTNFDLDVTCLACGGTTQSSNNLTGDDVVGVRRPDTSGMGDTYTVVIGVRWTSSSACGSWSLTVAGGGGARRGRGGGRPPPPRGPGPARGGAARRRARAAGAARGGARGGGGGGGAPAGVGGGGRAGARGGGGGGGGRAGPGRPATTCSATDAGGARRRGRNRGRSRNIRRQRPDGWRTVDGMSDGRCSR